MCECHHWKTEYERQETMQMSMEVVWIQNRGQQKKGLGMGNRGCRTYGHDEADEEAGNIYDEQLNTEPPLNARIKKRTRSRHGVLLFPIVILSCGACARKRHALD
jgi:hypothetical protein